MPGSLYSWYGPQELGVLGHRKGVLSGEIELSRLKRLAGLLSSASGSVQASLRFRQEQGGWLIIDVEYDTTVQLVCQRCLEPVDYHVQDRVEMALLESAALEQHLPEAYEPLVLENERLMPAMLVEEEIIISLPIIPRHERVQDCGSLADEWILKDDGSESE